MLFPNSHHLELLTVCRLVVNEHSQLPRLNTVLALSRALGLLPDLAKQGEMRRAEVAQVANFASLSEHKQIQ